MTVTILDPLNTGRASLRRHAPNGKQGCCLLCGTTLRRKYMTKKVGTSEYRKPKWNCCGKGWKLKKDGWFECAHCGHEAGGTEIKRITERQPVYPLPGDYGDGFFCGLRCGWEFACVMAAGHRRIQSPRNPK